MKWTTSPLNSVAKIVRGVSFSAQEISDTEKNNTIGVLRAGNIQEKLIVNSDLLYIPSSKVKEQQLIRSGDIAMCTSSGSPKIVGKVAYAENDADRTVGAFCCIIRPQKKLVSSKYLFHFFNSSIFKNWAEISPGANIKNIKISALQNFVVPLPPLAEQRRIAAILDKVDAIRRKRQQSLKLIDDLVKSQFIEMFGDPVTNPMGWDSGALGCKIQTIMAGESVNGEARLLEKGEKAVLKISAVTYGYFDPSEYKVIQNQKGIKKYVYPQKGDLLFSRANTRELVGATAIVPRDFPDLLLPDKLWRLTFHNGLNTYFVKHVLSTDAVRMAMSKQATGTSGSMFNISMKKLKKLTVPVPPLPLQNQFAAFVEQADKSKFTMQRQLSEIEILSSSLKQKFFA